MKTSEEGGRAAQAPGLLRTTGARPPAQRFGVPSSEPREELVRDPEAVAQSEALIPFLIGWTTPGPVRPENRCMGKRCSRKADWMLVAIDESQGAHEHPVRLCRRCLTKITEGGSPVDLFRWLSNGRIEADA